MSIDLIELKQYTSDSIWGAHGNQLWICRLTQCNGNRQHCNYDLGLILFTKEVPQVSDNRVGIDKLNRDIENAHRLPLAERIAFLKQTHFEEEVETLPYRQRLYFGRILRYLDHENIERTMLFPPEIDIRHVAKAAESRDHILIHGPTGSGKDALANYIAFLANIDIDTGVEKTPKKKVHAINCARFSPELVASELFGYLAGSHSTAEDDHKGIIEKADNGILILEELGTIPKEHQAAILQFIQDGLIIPIGGTTEDQIRVSTRIIATTNVNIVDQAIFRQDLQHRFVWQFELTDLRERRGDIPLFFDYFLTSITPKKEWKIPVCLLLPLLLYDWPGNIRELRNYCKRLAQIGELIQDNDDYFTLLNISPDTNHDGHNHAEYVLSKFEPVLESLPECLDRDPCFNFGMLVLAESAGILTNEGTGSFIPIQALHDDDEMCSLLPSEDIIKSSKNAHIFPRFPISKRVSLFEFLGQLYNPAQYHSLFHPAYEGYPDTPESFTDDLIKFVCGSIKENKEFTTNFKKKPVTTSLSSEMISILSKLKLPEVQYGAPGVIIFPRLGSDKVVLSTPTHKKLGRRFGRLILDRDLLTILRSVRGLAWKDASKQFHSVKNPKKLLYGNPVNLRKRIYRFLKENESMKVEALECFDSILKKPMKPIPQVGRHNHESFSKMADEKSYYTNRLHQKPVK